MVGRFAAIITNASAAALVLIGLRFLKFLTPPSSRGMISDAACQLPMMAYFPISHCTNSNVCLKWRERGQRIYLLIKTNTAQTCSTRKKPRAFPGTPRQRPWWPQTHKVDPTCPSYSQLRNCIGGVGMPFMQMHIVIVIKLIHCPGKYLL